MPRKIKKTAYTDALETVGKTIQTIAKAIWAIILQIGELLKSILIIIEKSLKIIAIFIIAISASVLFIFTSLFLFSSTFGLKDSPAFQGLRDRIAEIYALSAEDELDELEAKLEADQNTDNPDTE